MEKMTQKEAFKAACEFVNERMGNESISIPIEHDPVTSIYHVHGFMSGSSRMFKYYNLDPAPKKGTPVIDLKDGEIGYSLGELRGDGRLKVSTSRGHDTAATATYFESWDTFEIVRNGRHSMALILLEDCMNMLQFKDTAPRTVEQVREFLDDEPGKGGE